MRISDWSSDVCSSDLVGASPGEDELVIVAQEENIVLALRKEAQKTILTLIGVLIFVDHDGVELTCPCPGHLRITLERQKWLQNEVVKVHAIVFAHARFIFLEHFKVRLLPRLVFEAAARPDERCGRPDERRAATAHPS